MNLWLQDLQVNSSPPVQPVASTSSIDSDPAIIQVNCDAQLICLELWISWSSEPELISAVSLSSSDCNTSECASSCQCTISWCYFSWTTAWTPWLEFSKCYAFVPTRWKFRVMGAFTSSRRKWGCTCNAYVLAWFLWLSQWASSFASADIAPTTPWTCYATFPAATNAIFWVQSDFTNRSFKLDWPEISWDSP